VNLFEVVAALFGVVNVFLTVRENIWCWPTGIVNVAMYIVVFHDAKLYADMGLQVVYLALSFYGWYEWLHGGKNHGTLRVSRTPRAVLAALGLAGVAGSVVLGRFLSAATDAALPFWDASTTSCSLVAQAMLTRKWIENWALWIAVDVVYIGMYVYKRLYVTAVLYAVFLGLSVLGLREWKAALKAEA
jgi:nicotinamide mononucleotide transporter